ncbi:hypothetical protein GO491_04070 [Flavobacteriaceae bacterium Ap0902]|nr:hypothetical protein [Flavobacteriaceae bacterium Ap0902]
MLTGMFAFANENVTINSSVTSEVENVQTLEFSNFDQLNSSNYLLEETLEDSPLKVARLVYLGLFDVYVDGVYIGTYHVYVEAD